MAGNENNPHVIYTPSFDIPSYFEPIADEEGIDTENEDTSEGTEDDTDKPSEPMMPKFFKPMPVKKPEFDLDNFEINLIKDFEDESLAGYAYYDSKTHALNVYMPSHVIEFELNYEALVPRVMRGTERFKLSDIGSVVMDESMLPTCKYFIPSKKQETSEVPSNWRYATGFVKPSCVCPKLGKSTRNPGVCDEGLYMKHCGGFEALEDEVYLEVKDTTTNESLVTVSKHFSPPRIVTFVVNDTEQTRLNTPEEVQAHIAKYLNADVTEVVHPAKQRDSYFQKVFS